MMKVSSNNVWDSAAIALLRSSLYTGGYAACRAAFPDKSRGSINGAIRRHGGANIAFVKVRSEPYVEKSIKARIKALDNATLCEGLARLLKRANSLQVKDEH